MRNVLGQFIKGSEPWSKTHEYSPEVREKMRLAKLKNPTRYWLGRKRSDEFRRVLSIKNKGKRLSIQTRLKMSQSRIGEKCNFWKGGVTTLNKSIRSGLKYRLWRESVFKRDNWTCQMCNTHGGELQADHIKPFAYFPKLRFEISNGRTLCVPCHKQTDTYLGKINTYLKTI